MINMTVTLHFCKVTVIFVRGCFFHLKTATLVWEEYKKIPTDDWIVTMKGAWFK
ncbi:MULTISPECIES: hypothetical protein [unclassified Bacillus cereus group]|uniref:hypothetical protein n=1 Tax=unclassified Bacillus cereus group TaxID=2750818 RepID=UPI001F581EB2